MMERPEKNGPVGPGPSPAWMGPALLGAVLVVWAGVLNAPFLFDDHYDILQNPSIRQILPLKTTLWPPPGTGTAGRPLANLTLAVNWAASGASPWSYHLVNLLIHAISTLLLFGILKRTFASERLCSRLGAAGNRLAFFSALFFGVHPLVTETVTLSFRRPELLAACLSLAVLYTALRGFFSRQRTAWFALSAACFFLAAGSKETAAAAPLAVFLFDRAFASGSAKTALSRNRALYLSYVAGYAFLAFLVLAGGRGGRIETSTLWTPFQYLAAQPAAIFRYLSLMVLPSGLCLEYDWLSVPLSYTLPALMVVGGLFLLTLAGVWKNRSLGVAGAWFFLFLAPTSSILPLGSLASEHRAYLALAGFAALFTVGLWGLWSRAARRTPGPGIWVLFSMIALALATGSMVRNNLYNDPVAIWTDTVEKAPNNHRSVFGLGVALAEAGDLEKAMEAYRQVLRMNPGFAPGHYNLGLAYMIQCRIPDAVRSFEEAHKYAPHAVQILNNLGIALAEAGREDEAVRIFSRALKENPKFGRAHYNLAYVLFRGGDIEGAVKHLEKAVELTPGLAQPRLALGMALVRAGKPDQAVRYFNDALILAPKNPRVLHCIEEFSENP